MVTGKVDRGGGTITEEAAEESRVGFLAVGGVFEGGFFGEGVSEIFQHVSKEQKSIIVDRTEMKRKEMVISLIEPFHQRDISFSTELIELCCTLNRFRTLTWEDRGNEEKSDGCLAYDRR